MTFESLNIENVASGRNLHVKTHIFTLFSTTDFTVLWRSHAQMRAKHTGHAGNIYLHFCRFKTVCLGHYSGFQGHLPELN